MNGRRCTLPAPPQQASALFVAKTKADGTFEWVKTTNVDSTSQAVTVDAQNAIYVAGQLRDDLTLAGKTITSTGSDLFVAKLSSDGTFVWINATQGPAEGFALATNAATEIFVAGEFGPGAVMFGTKSATAQGNLDAFVAKLDKQGEFLWVVPAPTSTGKLSRATALSFRAPDALLVAGYFFDKITFHNALTAQDARDAFLARLRDQQTQGIWDWAAAVGSQKDQQAQGVAVDANGSAYLTGWLEDSIQFFPPGVTSPTQHPALGTRDLFLWKISLP